MPQSIDDPPPGWASGYPDIARGLAVTPPDVTSAMRLLRSFWTEALKADTNNES